jgi:hypothetical protein
MISSEEISSSDEISKLCVCVSEDEDFDNRCPNYVHFCQRVSCLEKKLDSVRKKLSITKNWLADSRQEVKILNSIKKKNKVLKKKLLKFER